MSGSASAKDPPATQAGHHGPSETPMQAGAQLQGLRPTSPQGERARLRDKGRG